MRNRILNLLDIIVPVETLARSISPLEKGIVIFHRGKWFSFDGDTLTPCEPLEHEHRKLLYKNRFRKIKIFRKVATL